MAASGSTFYFPWEVALMKWLQTHISGGGISIISLFSAFGEALLLILILGFVYWDYDKKLGRTMALSIFMGLVWNTMLKNIFLRRRPYFDHDDIHILRVPDPEADIDDIAAQGYSFPSGHSTNAVTVYGSLGLYLHKRYLTAAAIVIPFLIGFSRIVVGAHYPTDVLAGWLLGLLSVLLVHLLEKRVPNLLLSYGILLITAIPGFFYCKTTDYFNSIGLLIGFMGGTLLEDHCVHFENTRKPLWMIARMLGGLAVFLALNQLLKLPFSEEFLSSSSFGALMVRCIRYAIIAFVEFGVYPMLFKFEKKVTKENG